jgi:hypothetical protein
MNEDVNTHWLYPFYNKMNETKSVACSPYMNMFSSNLTLSCHFTFFKLENGLIDLLIDTNVLGKKKNKHESCTIGENNLSKVLSDKYNICSLFFKTNADVTNIRKELSHDTNMDILANTIFIKNTWRYLSGYVSTSVLYDYCIDFFNKKLNINPIFKGINIDYLDFSKYKFKADLYKSTILAEQPVLYFKNCKVIHKSCVIYVHYDSNNIIADYVLTGLKVLFYIGYDIYFFTATDQLKNIDINILPFKVNFIKNQSYGTDYKCLLLGLNRIKSMGITYEWVMFMNCSLLFPINGITNFINTIKETRKNCDFWGHWESPEVSFHLVGVPVEFKWNTISTLTMFLTNNLPTCKTKFDFINNVETKILVRLHKDGFKHNSVINMNDINVNLLCPTHHPDNIVKYINKPKTFAIKWKYVIQFLDQYKVSGFFNDLSKYLWYGNYGHPSGISIE